MESAIFEPAWGGPLDGTKKTPQTKVTRAPPSPRPVPPPMFGGLAGAPKSSLRAAWPASQHVGKPASQPIEPRQRRQRAGGTPTISQLSVSSAGRPTSQARQPDSQPDGQPDNHRQPASQPASHGNVAGWAPHISSRFSFIFVLLAPLFKAKVFRKQFSNNCQTLSSADVCPYALSQALPPIHLHFSSISALLAPLFTAKALCNQFPNSCQTLSPADVCRHAPSQALPLYDVHVSPKLSVHFLSPGPFTSGARLRARLPKPRSPTPEPRSPAPKSRRPTPKPRSPTASSKPKPATTKPSPKMTKPSHKTSKPNLLREARPLPVFGTAFWDPF